MNEEQSHNTKRRRNTFLFIILFYLITMFQTISCYLSRPQNQLIGRIQKQMIQRVHRMTSRPSSSSDTNTMDSNQTKSLLPDNTENPIFQSKQLFQQLCKSPELLEILEKNQLEVATEIQGKSYQTIFSGKDVILGAETGSGKTLAYFLPIIDRAIQERAKRVALAKETEGSSPLDVFAWKPMKGIILTPSTELCDQVIRMTKMITQPFSEKAGFNIVIERRAEKCLTWIPRAEDPALSEQSELQIEEGSSSSSSNLYEFVICTPRNLYEIIRHDTPRSPTHPLQDLNTLILDEADMLLDGSYAKEVESIVSQLKLVRRSKIQRNLIGISDKTIQFILAVASLPTYGLRSIEKAAKRLFPLTDYIKTDYLHQHHPKITQEYIPLTAYQMENPIELLEIILSKLSDITSQPNELAVLSQQKEEWWKKLDSSIMIFFNTAAKAQQFAELLQSEASIPSVQMHSLISKAEREENLQTFQDQTIRIMICTDSCARGLDLPFVKYVIQAEFALNVVQHLHRIGRASRAGKEGIAINFYHPSVAPLVESITGKVNYNMEVGDGLEEDERSTAKGAGGKNKNHKEKSTIEQSFSRRRGFRNKVKKYISSSSAQSTNNNHDSSSNKYGNSRNY